MKKHRKQPSITTKFRSINSIKSGSRHTKRSVKNEGLGTEIAIFVLLPIIFLIFLGFCSTFFPNMVFISIISLFTILFGFLLSRNINKKYFLEEQNYRFWTYTIGILELSFILSLFFQITQYSAVFYVLFISSILVGLFYYHQIFLKAKNAAILATKQKIIEEIRHFSHEREGIKQQRLSVEQKCNDLIVQTEGIGLPQQTQVHNFYQSRKVAEILNEIEQFSKKTEFPDIAVFNSVKNSVCDCLAEEKVELEKEKLSAIILQNQIREFIEKKNEEEEQQRRQKTIEEGMRLEAIHREEYEQEMKRRIKQSEQEWAYFKDLFLK